MRMGLVGFAIHVSTDPGGRPDRMGAVTYDPETLWTFRNKKNGIEKRERLLLRWEPNYSTIGEDYTPGDLSAADVWHRWIKAVNWQKEADRLGLPLGNVGIHWLVEDAGEAAPFWDVEDDEDFLTWFTWPVNDAGERVQWTRCPVLDYTWNEQDWYPSGFIQSATGWKPSPLQRAMDLVQIARASSLPAPEL